MGSRRQAEEDALTGGIDHDAGAQYDDLVLFMESRADDNIQTTSSGAGGEIPLAVPVQMIPVKPTDLALVKSDVKPDVKPAKKEKAEYQRVASPWTDTDCTAVKEGRNGWDQYTKTAFVAALLNARPASEKEVFTRYASISTTSFKVGLPKKLWNQAAYYEFARYICSEYPVRRACCACYNSCMMTIMCV